MASKNKNNKAQKVAKYILYLANNNKKEVTNKKLQKLVYYSQAWSLAINNKKLFNEEIEAWVHGPAIRSLYTEYKHFGFNPIEEKIKISDITLTKKEKDLINQVWNVYGKFDAGYLEMLTHSEKPWQEARRGLEGYENSDAEISTDTMKKFYKEKLEAVK